MKTSAILTVLLFALLPFSQAIAATDPLLVIRQERIYLLTDETPVFGLELTVTDSHGEVLRNKRFQKDTEVWHLEIATLPSGSYTVWLDGKPVARFSHTANHKHGEILPNL